MSNPSEDQNLSGAFLEALQQYIGRDKNQKDELSKELSLSTSSLYKKLRGDIAFTLDEVGYLASKYNISLDGLKHRVSSAIVVNAPQWDKPIQSIPHYLMSLRAIFESYGERKDMQVWYAAREAPLFYYFNQPKLGLFKLYTYARTVWKLPEFTDHVKFSSSLFAEEVQYHISELWQHYAGIPSVEIWNPNVFDNTLQQILYLVEERKFAEIHDAPELLSSLRQIVYNIVEMVQKGHKLNAGLGKPATLQLYNNKMMHTNNLIVASTPQVSRVFMTHDNPNILWSDNEIMINYTMDWMERLKENSNFLNTNPAQLNQFKESILRKIELTEQKVKAVAMQKEEFI